MQQIEQYLIDKADQCIRLARAGREMADSLEAMSHELMARAVVLDSERDRVAKDVEPRRVASGKA